MTKSSVPVKPLSVSKITKNIKRPRSTIVPEKISLSRNLIFICYSHKDEKWRNEVEESIKSMQLEGIELDYWSDQRLRTSEVWQDEIFRILSKSKIAILLVSKSFLASEFIQKQELPRILEKAKGDELRVMSIIINYCRFEENKRLSKYHSLNPPNTPLVSMGEDKQGYFLYKLTKDIESFIHPESF